MTSFVRVLPRGSPLLMHLHYDILISNGVCLFVPSQVNNVFVPIPGKQTHKTKKSRTAPVQSTPATSNPRCPPSNGPSLPQGGLRSVKLPKRGTLGGVKLSPQGGLGGVKLSPQGGLGGVKLSPQGGLGGVKLSPQGGLGGVKLSSQGGLGGVKLSSQGGLGGIRVGLSRNAKIKPLHQVQTPRQ